MMKEHEPSYQELERRLTAIVQAIAQPMSFVAGKIESDQPPEDDEGSNDEQAGHFSLTALRRNKPKINGYSRNQQPNA